MSTNRRPVKFGSLAAGVNNRLEPTQLDHGERGAPATYLYGANNVDINAAGYLKRRRGITSAIDGRAHSLWGDAAGGFAVIDGDLTQLTPAGATLAQAVVRAGMPNLPVSYSRGGDCHVYWSNGRDIGRIVAQADRPVITPALASNPFVSVTSGALPRGRYLIAFTVMGDDGESASTVPRQLDVPENGGLHIEGLPGSNVAAYLSGPNGDVLTLAGSGTDTSLDVLSLPAGGMRCQTLLLSAMPAGQIVRHYKASLLVAAGNTLQVSLPYLYGLTDAASRYLPFPAPISVVEPTENGLWVCADQTYWLAGDLFAAALVPVLPYGASPGSGGSSGKDKLAYWLSPRGLVMADAQGSAKAVQDDALAFSSAASGATLYREMDGMRHIVAARAGVEPVTTSATHSRTAQTIREGTLL